MGVSKIHPGQHGMSCRENITSAVYVGVRFVTTRHADKYCLRLTIFLRWIVQILALPDGDSFFIRFTGIKYDQCRRVSVAFIDGQHFRLIVVADGFAEEAQRCCRIFLSYR